jgi:carboxyl-terminal processing protease
MISLLKKNYANLYVNDEAHKRRVVSELENYFKTHDLNETSEKDVSLILNQMNDGHVLLKNNNSKNPRKHSDLEFLPGTFFLKNCFHSCNPKVEAGKYEIVAVDKKPFAEWLEEKKVNVYASSPWGRKFRTSRLIASNKIANSFQLTLKNSGGKIYETTTRTDINDRPIRKCIDGQRVDKNTYYINIKTLWCDKENNELFTNYSKEWNNATAEITKQDKIIIDLRENNGGDDWEVMYTLNSFIKDNIVIYKYQYLSLNQPGKFTKLLHLLPFKFKLWGPMGEDYSQGPNPERTFFDNPVNVLISPGCFSSCEGLAAAFKNQKRAKLFGSQTHGGAGEPRFFSIGATGYALNLPTALTWQSNGVLFEGVGIIPDEMLEDKLEFSGDFVLKTAIEK